MVLGARVVTYYYDAWCTSVIVNVSNLMSDLVLSELFFLVEKDNINLR